MATLSNPPCDGASAPAVGGVLFGDSSRVKNKAPLLPPSLDGKSPAAIVKKWKHSQACTKRKASPCNSMMASWRYKSPAKKSKSKSKFPSSTKPDPAPMTDADLTAKIDAASAKLFGRGLNHSNNYNVNTPSSSQQQGPAFPSNSSSLTRLFPLKSHLVSNPIEKQSRIPTFLSSPPSSPPMSGIRLGYPNGSFSSALYESSSSPLSPGPSSPDVSCTAGIPHLPSASVVASMSQPPSTFAYGPRPGQGGFHPLTQMDLYYLWMSVPQELLPYPYQVMPYPSSTDPFSRQLPCLPAMPIATTD